MLSLLVLSVALADCPVVPRLRDDDDRVSVLSQNLKFIATGTAKADRAAILGDYLEAHPDIDLLLLSEARALDPLRDTLGDWCFYTQEGSPDAYQWAPGSLSPGGLVLGVRQRATGEVREVGAAAGRVYRARAVSLAEGFLGKIVGFEKGWAVVEVDGTSWVWTHTQASYERRPLLGVGSEGRGRAGQFADLAGDLGHAERPVLVTGDLNLLEGVNHPSTAEAARADAQTLERFSAFTGIRFAADRGPCREGSFLGTLRGVADSVFTSAVFDRVGTNAAFDAQHPDTALACERIEADGLHVSDHLGIRISAPFATPVVYTPAP